MIKVTDTDRFKHVSSSLLFCSQALNELHTLSAKYELEIVNLLIRQAPFNFYRGSLTYLLTLEYCKIFDLQEPGPKMSNIICLWNDAIKSNPSLKEVRRNPSVLKIKNIRSSSLLRTVRQLRNKRVAHSDIDTYNRPFNLRVFTPQEIEEIAVDLDHAINILNLLSQKEDLTTLGFPHQSSGVSLTEHFIHYTAISRAFHDNNIFLAYKQGYQAYQHTVVDAKEE